MARTNKPDLPTALNARHAGTMKLATFAPAVDTSALQYDYEQVAVEHRQAVMEAAVEILAQGNRAKQAIVAMGEKLIEVKDLLPHGAFTDWVQTEFELSERMARNFMNVARAYGGKTEIISVLSDTVLYLLAAPSTPDAARAEVEQAAVSGQKVTVEFAKEAVRKAKPEPETPLAALENMIYEWAYNHAVATNFSHDEVLRFVAEGTTTRADKERKRMATWLAELGCTWRDGILERAARRVWERRQRELRQAQAQAVYVEPTSEPQTPLAHARDEVGIDGRTRREYTISRLITVPPHDGNFRAALDEAIADELIEALGKIPAAGNKTKRERIEARLRKVEPIPARAVYVEPSPTPDDEEAAEEPIETMPLPSIILYKHLIDAGFVLEALLVNGDRRTRWAWPTDGFRGPWAYAPSMALQQALEWYEKHERDARALEVATPDDEEAALGGNELLRADDLPPMPADLAALGFCFIKANATQWAIVRDEEPEKYESDWCFDPGDCVDDVREMLSSDRENVGDKWIANALADSNPTNVDFMSALNMATAVELREALSSLSTEDAHHRARLDALIARLEELESLPTPTLPPDLTAAGFRVIQPKPDRWAILREAGPVPFESNWVAADDLDLAIEETRAFLAEIRFADFEAWLASAPREPDLAVCLGILELAKTMAVRVRNLSPDMENYVTNALPTWSQLIIKLEKKVKHG